MPVFIHIVFMGALAGGVVYWYKKGRKYWDVDAEGENIMVKKQGQSISFTINEIGSIETVESIIPLPWYLTIINLREEKNGHRYFAFLAVNNGYLEKYLFNPFVKAGGKIERQSFIGFH